MKLPIILGWIAYSITFYSWSTLLDEHLSSKGWARKFLIGIVIYLFFFLPYLNWNLLIFIFLINGFFLWIKKWHDIPRETNSIRTFLLINILMLYLHYRVLVEISDLNQWVAPYFSQIFNLLSIQGTTAIVSKTFIHALGLLWILWGGTFFVRSILHPIIQPPKEEVSAEEYRRGKIIGNLERLLIYGLFQINMPALISIVIGLKALARFKQLDDKEFAEYFLIGTLASVFIAITISIFIQWMLRAIL